MLADAFEYVNDVLADDVIYEEDCLVIFDVGVF